MTLTIARESPLTQDASTLIDGSQAALRAVYTEAECFNFTAQELDETNIQFFVARLRGRAVGCVALCARDGYGEIKRLFVTPHARGTGAALALMNHLETRARAVGLQLMRLETGAKLAAGVALYRSIGYKVRGPFSDYTANPASLFMEKSL